MGKLKKIVLAKFHGLCFNLSIEDRSYKDHEQRERTPWL